MKTSMTLFGCGPKLALLDLPYIILSFVVMYRYPEFFDLKFLDFTQAEVPGFIWLGLGVIFWIPNIFETLVKFLLLPVLLVWKKHFPFLTELYAFK